MLLHSCYSAPSNTSRVPTLCSSQTGMKQAAKRAFLVLDRSTAAGADQELWQTKAFHAGREAKLLTCRVPNSPTDNLLCHCRSHFRSAHCLQLAGAFQYRPEVSKQMLCRVLHLCRLVCSSAGASKF